MGGRLGRPGRDDRVDLVVCVLPPGDVAIGGVKQRFGLAENLQQSLPLGVVADRQDYPGVLAGAPVARPGGRNRGFGCPSDVVAGGPWPSRSSVRLYGRSCSRPELSRTPSHAGSTALEQPHQEGAGASGPGSSVHEYRADLGTIGIALGPEKAAHVLEVPPEPGDVSCPVPTSPSGGILHDDEVGVHPGGRRGPMPSFSSSPGGLFSMSPSRAIYQSQEHVPAEWRCRSMVASRFSRPGS